MLRLLRRLARVEINPLDEEVFGQLSNCGRALVAIESFHDLAIDEPGLAGDPKQLRLRQSTTDSRGPEINIGARIEGKLSLDHDIGKI